MKFDFSLKLTVPVLIALFALGVIGYVYQNSLSVIVHDSEQNAVRDVRRDVVTTQSALEILMGLKREDGVDRIVATHGATSYHEVMLVFNPQGIILHSSQYADKNRSWQERGYSVSPLLIQKTQSTRAIDISKSEDGLYLNSYAPVCSETNAEVLRPEQCNTLFYQINLESFKKQSIAQLQQQFVEVAIGISVTAFIVWWIFNFILTRPANHIVHVMTQFSSGQREARSLLTGKSELAKIGATVDRMLDRIVDDERLLRERKEYLSMLFQSVAEAIVTIDDGGHIVSANKEVETVFGYRVDELVGRNIDTLLPAKCMAMVYRMGKDTEKRSQMMGHRCEWIGYKKDGQQIPVEVGFSPVEVAGSLQYVGVIRDISERKKAEEGLSLARRVFDNSGEAIMITDKDTKIIDVNPALLNISGYSRDELIGKPPSVMKSGRHDAAFYQEMWRSIGETGSWCGEMWDRRKNGELYPKKLTINAIKDSSDRVTHYVGIFADITDQKTFEEKLERLAYYDPLTHLPNRALFQDRLQHEIHLSQRNSTRCALLFVDLDRFKYVNDTLGHNVGDELLIEVADRIKSCVRVSDTVARLGGDEFTLILPNVKNEPNVAMVAKNVINELQKPFFIGGKEVFIGASIGIGIHPDDGEESTTLIKNADTAMYQAKEGGRGQYRFYTPEMNERNMRRMELENNLRYAIEKGQLSLHYQPKIHLATDKIEGFEALLRWEHPTLGKVSPLEFIPVAEDTGLIISIGDWVIRTACNQLRQWEKSGLGQLKLAINLSAKQFQQPNLVERVGSCLSEMGIKPEQLEIEITESVIMEDFESSIRIMEQLSDMGVVISVDDFGTGYSSLSYLKRLPIESLKIDRSFVKELTTDADDRAIVHAVVSMANSLNLKVVAEGVETIEQERYLRECGCDQVQGFYYARPMPARDVESFMGGDVDFVS